MKCRIIALAGFIGSLTACGGGGSGSNDADPVVQVFGGTRPSVEQIYSESQLAALETLGVQINLGSNPPDIEGTYRIDPNTLQATSVPNDQANVGNIFEAVDVTFSNQNNTTLTLDLSNSSSSGNTSVVGTGSFISGARDAFTVYFLAEVTQDGHTFESTETYSGIVTEAGIENLQQAVFVIDDRGDPNGSIIPVDTGRLFIDLDGLSSRLDALSSGESAPESNETFAKTAPGGTYTFR